MSEVRDDPKSPSEVDKLLHLRMTWADHRKTALKSKYALSVPSVRRKAAQKTNKLRRYIPNDWRRADS